MASGGLTHSGVWRSWVMPRAVSRSTRQRLRRAASRASRFLSPTSTLRELSATRKGGTATRGALGGIALPGNRHELGLEAAPKHTKQLQGHGTPATSSPAVG